MSRWRTATAERSRAAFCGLLWGALALATAARAEDGLFDGRTLLVMVDDVGCVYCAKWDRDVRAGYEASAEGRFAPLERHRIGSNALVGLGRLAYTPTFVLIVRGREAGRIVGYGGADFFWAEIEQLYAKAGFRPDTAPPPPVENRAGMFGPVRTTARPG